MRQTVRFASLLLVASSIFAFGQQSTTPPATSSTPSASSQDLPDSPGTNAHVSPQPTGPTAILDTSMGRITCKLFSKEAPETVANFVTLAEGKKDWTDPVTHKKM